MTATQLTIADALDASGDWAGQVRRAIETMAATGQPFMAYDLVEAYGLPEPSSPKAWGSAFSAARKAGVIRHVGFAASKRPSVAGSAASVWVGA